jgi:hypothetical protein
MPLSYLRDDCHKQAVTHIRESRWFESMYTLQGKTWPMWHIRFPCQSTYTRHMIPADSLVRGNLLWSLQQRWIEPLLPRKRAPNTIPSTSADWFTGPYPVFSPEPAIEAVGVKPPCVSNQLLGLPGPYHRHAIGTFNTCSRGPIHRSLTDTGGGYNLGGASLPHTTPRPSQPAVSTLL